jgi:regulator of nucleoside diphosphate kinase
MTAGKILVTEHDARRLTELLVRSEGFNGPDRPHLEALAEKLEHAAVVPPETVPADVVTIHSEVRIHHLDSDATATYTLVPSSDPP